jgi:hypothetical protein
MYIFVHFPGTNSALQRHRQGWVAVTRRGNTVLSSRYIARQITTLLKFAKTTSDRGIAAAVLEKATALKERVEEITPSRDLSPRAPDVEPPLI